MSSGNPLPDADGRSEAIFGRATTVGSAVVAVAVVDNLDFPS